MPVWAHLTVHPCTFERNATAAARAKAQLRKRLELAVRLRLTAYDGCMAQAQVITIRGATPHDNLAAYRVLYLAVNDLARRIGTGPIPGDVETSYARGEQLFRYLADTAAEFWVAENADGIVGYARCIEHGGFFELTEFFVLPEHQSAGIGRRL